ncbi:MAG: AAA family ATPase [Bacteroidaceae bacterium]|nr:AAA family ATPase [Bacteroidaceae bacterium]
MDLLTRFSAQDQDTIWAFLRKISDQKLMFMNESPCLKHAFANNGVYLYVQEGQAVLLVMDALQSPSGELIDEEPFAGEDPMWFTEQSHRTSPVYRLRQLMKLLEDSCRKEHITQPQLMGVLLTSSRLINLDDYEENLADLQVKIIDRLLPEEMPLKLRAVELPSDGAAMLAAIDEMYDHLHRRLPHVEPEWVPTAETEEAEAQKSREKGMRSRHDEGAAVKDPFQQGMEDLFGPLSDDDKPYSLPPEDQDDDQDDDLDLDEHDFGDYDSDPEPFPPFGKPLTEEEAFFKRFDEHINKVRASLDEQYPDTLGSCSIPSRVEVRRPTYHPDEDFDRLVGCQKIRAQIAQLTILSQYNQRRLRLEPRALRHELMLHAIFTGNPGVGKSTVCKLYGSLLRQAGVLEYGHVVVCDRSTFVGTHWGDEEKTVRAVLQMARGGVLMIDEAYQLLGDLHPNDPGRLVMPLMMNVLADPAWCDVAVVLCGYPEPMQQLLKQNMGLFSRFPNRFFFPDFTIEELEQITLKNVATYGYHFSRAAWAKYRWFLREAYDQRTDRWPNARFVTNWLDQIYLLHALRSERDNLTTLRQLHILTQDDISLPATDYC